MKYNTAIQQEERESEIKNEQKQMIINQLRDNGCRITHQRLVLLDVILGNECTSCKEIYYRASKVDKNIGFATVYRMINMLEEIGVINRKNMYRIEDLNFTY